MNVFVSVPLRGHSAEEVQDTLKTALEALRIVFKGSDVKILEGVTKIDSRGKNEGVMGLGNAITKMADADAVLFCYGWGLSAGCAIEHEVAVRYGIKRLYMSQEGDIVEYMY